MIEIANGQMPAAWSSQRARAPRKGARRVRLAALEDGRRFLRGHNLHRSVPVDVPAPVPVEQNDGPFIDAQSQNAAFAAFGERAREKHEQPSHAVALLEVRVGDDVAERRPLKEIARQADVDVKRIEEHLGRPRALVGTGVVGDLALWRGAVQDVGQDHVAGGAPGVGQSAQQIHGVAHPQAHRRSGVAPPRPTRGPAGELLLVQGVNTSGDEIYTFLRLPAGKREHDVWTLVEPPEAQRAITQHMIQERRRVRDA